MESFLFLSKILCKSPKQRKTKLWPRRGGDPGWIPFTFCSYFTFIQVAFKGLWEMVWEKPELSEDWSTLRFYAAVGKLGQVLTRSRNEIVLHEDCSI